MRDDEQTPLARSGERERERVAASSWPVLRLLVVPFILGLLQTVATAAEVDALRSLACTEYYAYNAPAQASEPDATSCRLPVVEAHFSDLMFRVTVSVTLANLLGMLIYGRHFRLGTRRWMAALGMLGNLVARIPMVILPLAQYPYLLSGSLRAISATAMVRIYWACLIACGLSGASELVVLCLDSYIVDDSSPQIRSSLFARIQVAQLLGASIGPTLGHVAVALFPNMANRRFGYTHPLHPHAPFLFNTASYWLTIVIAFIGIVWVAFVVRPLTLPSKTKHAHGQSPQIAPHWLGQYRLLVPRHIRGWKYDCRIAQFTLAESFNGLAVEGVVVLVYILGYVFRWGQTELSYALTVSNTLNLAMTVFGFPLVTRVIMRHQRPSAGMRGMSPDAVHRCLELRDADHDVSDEQRQAVQMWRTKVDLNAARLSLASNTLSWLTLALGVWLLSPAVVIIGGCALSLGVCAAPMIRSAACTVADVITGAQSALPVPHGARGVAPRRGADSYLVIVSTLLLPVMLTGPVLRNWVYSATLSTFPGAFFIVIAGLQATALLLLAHA